MHARIAGVLYVRTKYSTSDGKKGRVEAALENKEKRNGGTPEKSAEGEVAEQQTNDLDRREEEEDEKGMRKGYTGDSAASSRRVVRLVVSTS
jgi:hypothetical protein